FGITTSTALGSTVRRSNRIFGAKKDRGGERSHRHADAARESTLARRPAPSLYVDRQATRHGLVPENRARHRKASLSRRAAKFRKLPMVPSSSPCRSSRKAFHHRGDRGRATCLVRI